MPLLRLRYGSTGRDHTTHGWSACRTTRESANYFDLTRGTVVHVDRRQLTLSVCKLLAYEWRRVPATTTFGAAGARRGATNCRPESTEWLPVFEPVHCLVRTPSVGMPARGSSTPVCVGQAADYSLCSVKVQKRP